MFIETSFMRYGKGARRLIGLTLNEKLVKKWAYGLHICTEIIHDLEEMRTKNDHKNIQVHKEEMPTRVKSHGCDCEKIRIKLEQFINPLEPTQHPTSLVNVSTGYITKDNAVNVEKAVELGCQQIKSFVKGLPSSFHKAIPKQVRLLKSQKKGVRVGDVEIFNTEAIYARIMCLYSGSNNIRNCFET